MSYFRTSGTNPGAYPPADTPPSTEVIAPAVATGSFFQSTVGMLVILAVAVAVVYHWGR